MKALIISCLSLLTTLTANAARAADGVFDGQAVSTIGDDSGLSVLPARMAGTGKVVFRESLDAFGRDSSHALSFLIQEGGVLVFSSYAQAGLANGLDLVFKRNGRQLLVTLSKGGSAGRDVSGVFQSVDASRVVDLQVDIHNSENPAHILIWNGNEQDFSEDNALLNSEDGGVSPGAGSGALRGFTLSNAVVFKSTVSEVKFDHDHDHDH
jgi:hypothetical protein